MYSEMIAEIMRTFPQFSLNDILWDMTLKQFFMWYGHALQIQYNIPLKLKDTNDYSDELEKANNLFKWDTKKQRWV